MKKILFFILVFLLFSPLVVSAAEYFCKCSDPTFDGKKCKDFATKEEMAAACPACVQKEGKAAGDEECAGSIAVTSAESSSAPSSTPSSTDSASIDSGNVVKLNNPLIGKDKTKGETDVNAIIGNAIKTATGIMGALVLLMIVWGGVTWLTAAGSPEKIKSGSNTIMWAILGAIVVLSSYLLLTAVLKGLSG